MDKVPGIDTLGTGRDAGINAVSCATAGNCTALGSYSDSSGGYQVFVANKA